jgi:tetratricopeptide (TPR) repeat protein
MILRAHAALFALSISCFGADAQWVKARLGSFETISDNGRRSAVQGLSQFEQFRFALGTAMGKPDLVLDPPLRIVVFKTAQEMPPGCDTVHTGRDHLMACIVNPGNEAQLPPGLIRELTVRLLEANFSNLPAPIERALETFFSTVQSKAVHVTWGAPPPPADRSREWALIHMLITQPEYSGRAHIYLHNLAEGMDSNGAVRSLSEDPAKFNAAVDRYYAAGVFETAVAPSRPLNTDRDFATTNLTSDEGQLARADLLTPGSTAIYQSLLKAGKQVPESNEGLAIIAMREGNADEARHYMEAARTAGTHNVVALTQYGIMTKDSERAIEILKEALTLDPKYAEAHWALGEKISQPPRRLAEWKQAVALAPRRYDWWAQYAQLCQDQKQYAEAGRAWLAAAQAAPDAEHRDRYMASRGGIDELRLDDEAAERRKEAAAKAAEIDRLKAEARKEIADMEARVNTKPLSKEETEKAVDWFEINGSGSVTGTLTKVQCVNRQFQLDVKDDMGKTQRLLVVDPSQISILGGDGTLSCGGAQKPRPVSITFKPTKDKKGFAGEVTGIEFR